MNIYKKSIRTAARVDLEARLTAAGAFSMTSLGQTHEAFSVLIGQRKQKYRHNDRQTERTEQADKQAEITGRQAADRTADRQ